MVLMHFTFSSEILHHGLFFWSTLLADREHINVYNLISKQIYFITSVTKLNFILFKVSASSGLTTTSV